MTRRRAAAAVVVALAIVIAAAVVFWPDGGRDTPELDPVAADAHARRACRAFARFEQLVEDNAPGNEVYGALDETVAAAHDAADRDPRWRSLAGGTEALEVGFRNDNASAARTGLDVVRAQCATNE